MAKPIPESVYISRIKSAIEGRAEFLGWVGEFENSKTKVRLRCLIEGREWEPSIGSVEKGAGCPSCKGANISASKTTPESANLERLSKKADGKFTFDRVGEYAGIKGTKYACTCLASGRKWVDSLHYLLHFRGCTCQSCRPPKGAASNPSTKKNRRPPRLVDELPSKASGRYSFELVPGTSGWSSRYACTCLIDGYQWEASRNSLLSGSGCRKCADRKKSQQYTTKESEILSMIGGIKGIRFIGWVGAYRGGETRATLACDCSLEWEARASHIITTGTRCPSCSATGYDKAANGTLYALRSACGTMVKIGISNRPEQRHRQLAKATPFEWSCVDTVRLDNGVEIARMESELHKRMNRVGFDEPFDGHTEWMEWDDRVPEWFRAYRAQV